MLLQWKTWKRECPVFFRLSLQFYQMACVPLDKSFYFTGLSRNSNKWLLLQAIKKLSQWKVFWCLNSWSIEYFIDKRGGGMVVQLYKIMFGSRPEKLTDVMFFLHVSHTSAPHCLYLHTPGVCMGSSDIHCIATVGEHTYIHSLYWASLNRAF